MTPTTPPAALRPSDQPGRPRFPEPLDRRPLAGDLPAWPFALPFAGYGLGWVLGLGDFVWVLAAAVMTLLLLNARDVRVPRGFGLWLLFVAWMCFSATQLDSGSRLLGFTYRALLYLSATAVFVYAFNVRALTMRYVSGALTTLWLTTVAAGYVAVAAPLLTVRTPMSYLVPAALQDNDLVQEMVVRRVTQFDPSSWAQLAPRPSAPFLYTNNWGNAFSLLLPFVVAYLFHTRGERRFWLVALCLPLSFVPAGLTLNRGMFLGLAVGALYVVVRAVLGGNARMVLTLAAVGAGATPVLWMLPVVDRMRQRVAVSSTTQDRLELYLETVRRTMSSPLLGHGAPRPSESPFLDSVGTQGQVWMVLFSHGFVGLALFLAWFAFLALRALRRTDVEGVALGAVLVMASVEILYYGILATGLVVVMAAGAMVLRSAPGAPGPQADAVRPRPATGAVPAHHRAGGASPVG